MAAARGSTVEFELNGERHSVPIATALTHRLVEYIRCATRFKGTKIGCGQGGCGACTVAVLRPGERLPVSISSCLTPLPSVHGCKVITTEGLAKGGDPHPVQQRLATLNGSQCGYCSPGMVMQIFASLAGTRGGVTARESQLEQCLNGNLCRCTGYRPIVDTVKSFAGDTTVVDHLQGTAVGPYDEQRDADILKPPAPVPELSTHQWIVPHSQEGAAKAFFEGASAVAGNTAAGIYFDLFSTDPAKEFAGPMVDVSRVPELTAIKVDATQAYFGAAVTWSKLAEALRGIVGSRPALRDMLGSVQERVATIAGAQVRNSGTIGGNLAITRERKFASDLVPLLMSLGAKVGVMTDPRKQSTLSVDEYLCCAPGDKVFITGVTLPLPADGAAALTKTLCYRVAVRSHNSYALANYCAVLQMRPGGGVKEAAVTVGAVPFRGRPLALHRTALALKGWRGECGQLVADCGKAVEEDISALKAVSPYGPHAMPLDGLGKGDEATSYQLDLVKGFVRKTAIFAAGDGAPASERSAAAALHDVPRSSSSRQSFADHRTEQDAPVFEPINKTTAVGQAAGDCRFTDDFTFQGLNAAFVQAPVARGVLKGVDPSRAQAALGDALVRVVLASDLSKELGGERPSNTIPFGKNPMPAPPELISGSLEDEDILLPQGEASGFAGQPVAMVLVKGTPTMALRAAKLVTVHMEQQGPPACFPSDKGAISVGAKCEPEGVVRTRRGRPNEVIIRASRGEMPGVKVVDGGLRRFPQSHWYMEGQSCIASPDEAGGMDVALSAQTTNEPNIMVAHVLGLPQNRVTCHYRRVGGGFGGKVNRSIYFACAAAVAARLTGHPVRLVPPRSVDTVLTGGRQEMEGYWQAAVEEATGRVLAARVHIDWGLGLKVDFGRVTANMMACCADSVYAIPNMEVGYRLLQTTVAPRTAMRAPGHFEAIHIAETVMDGVAGALNRNPVEVREVNFVTGEGGHHFNLAGGLVPVEPVIGYSHLALWRRLKRDSRYEDRLRACIEFNGTNRWKKRAVVMTPARYGMFRFSGMTARLQIYRDASIIIHVAGSEIGQGLHTKVAQVAARCLSAELGVAVPLDAIHFADNHSHSLVNAIMTGGSTTSEGACFAIEEACRNMAGRLRQHAKKAQKWKDVIDASFSEMILGVLPVPPHLETDGYYKAPLQELAYETYAVAMMEAEIDVLTGESKLRAGHVLFDAGPSLNAAIDIGQCEGAFVIGMGQALNEGNYYDDTTGRNMASNTWTYKPPIATDIPEDFIMELVDMESEAKTTLGGRGHTALMHTLNAAGAAGKTSTGVRKFRSAKATGEPPILLGLCVHGVIREAARIARAQDGTASPGRTPGEFTLPMPAPPPVVRGVVAGHQEFAPPPQFPYEPVAEPQPQGGAVRTAGCAIAGVGAVTAAALAWRKYSGPK
eukprot:TRINITY_DN398_c0_g5_i1.p1 TRINITY_DN398_c0_g5~~TRINITY_DN398_c0_g5_i1.p1  ORF type:complete len:1455 (+),score=522.70 TRINITY_DN398_c0_g5_i1:101-4366(+)